MRDDFTEEVKRTLAARVGNQCSNPKCRALTSGPQDDSTKALNVGAGAHITAASAGGPRYDATLSPEKRCHADNGIWLCQTCAKLVDNDATQFPTELLRAWKTMAEHEARCSIGKTAAMEAGRSQAALENLTPVKVPSPGHNIRFVETAVISVYAEGQKIIRSPQNLGDFKALVACFRNEPAIDVDVLQPRLKAHIIYRDEDGHEIADASGGVWIEQYGDTTRFDLGSKKCIVVFLLTESDAVLIGHGLTHADAQLNHGKPNTEDEANAEARGILSKKPDISKKKAQEFVERIIQPKQNKTNSQ